MKERAGDGAEAVGELNQQVAPDNQVQQPMTDPQNYHDDDNLDEDNLDEDV